MYTYIYIRFTYKYVHVYTRARAQMFTAEVEDVSPGLTSVFFFFFLISDIIINTRPLHGRRIRGTPRHTARSKDIVPVVGSLLLRACTFTSSPSAAKVHLRARRGSSARGTRSLATDTGRAGKTLWKIRREKICLYALTRRANGAVGLKNVRARAPSKR